jgi:hypothetical protein
MANRNEAQVIGGHTAIIQIDGQNVGFMQGVTWNRDFGVQPVRVLGTIEHQEHQQTDYAITGEINKHYLRRNLGEDSKLDSRTAAQLVRTGTFDLVVLDDVTKKPIQVLEGCTLRGDSSGVQVGQLTTKRFTFQALRTR